MNVESLQIISKFMNDYEYEKAMELCEELLKKIMITAIFGL